MSNLGMGVMIQMLGGNESTIAALKDAVGKKIVSITLNAQGNSGDGQIEILFRDGSQLFVWDGGRSCCESRYITTEDDLSYFKNCTLKDVEGRSGEPLSSEYGDAHEIMFLDFVTTKGIVQFCTHNEHNGYYGGFWIQAELHK